MNIRSAISYRIVASDRGCKSAHATSVDQYVGTLQNSTTGEMKNSVRHSRIVVGLCNAMQHPRRVPSGICTVEGCTDKPATIDQSLTIGILWRGDVHELGTVLYCPFLSLCVF